MIPTNIGIETKHSDARTQRHNERRNRGENEYYTRGKRERLVNAMASGKTLLCAHDATAMVPLYLATCAPERDALEQLAAVYEISFKVQQPHQHRQLSASFYLLDKQIHFLYNVYSHFMLLGRITQK